MNYVINPDSTNTATVLAKAQADAVPTSRKQHPKGEGVTDAGSHPELTEESDEKTFPKGQRHGQALLIEKPILSGRTSRKQS